MKKLIYISVILFTIGLPANLSAQDSGQGVIEGQVINETEGGGSITGLDVALISQVEGETREILSDKTDSEGKFRFTGISVAENYLVRVCYMQIDYYYPVDFDVEETGISIEIPVCDTTTSDQAISIYLRHVILCAEDGYFSVTEVMWLLNEGDKTYVGSDETSFGEIQGTLVFILPEGAIGFGVPEESIGDYFLIDNITVTNTLVFPPGEKEIIFSYNMEVPNSGELIIELCTDYPADTLHVMVQGENIVVSSARLNPADPVIMDTGEMYIHLVGDSIGRGETVDIRLSSLSGDANVIPIILVSIAVVVIIGFATYFLMGKRAQVP